MSANAVVCVFMCLILRIHPKLFSGMYCSERVSPLLAALVLDALVVFPHGGVGVIHQFVVVRAVIARGDLVAALGLLAPALLASLVFGVVDQFGIVRAVEILAG